MTTARTDRPPSMPPIRAPIGADESLWLEEPGAGERVGELVCVDEVAVDCVGDDVAAGVRNAAALLESSLRAAATRCLAGHRLSLSHGFEVQHPKKVGPLVHVNHFDASVDEEQLWAGISLFSWDRNRPAARKTKDTRPRGYRRGRRRSIPGTSLCCSGICRNYRRRDKTDPDGRWGRNSYCINMKLKTLWQSRIIEEKKKREREKLGEES